MSKYIMWQTRVQLLRPRTMEWIHLPHKNPLYVGNFTSYKNESFRLYKYLMSQNAELNISSLEIVSHKQRWGNWTTKYLYYVIQRLSLRSLVPMEFEKLTIFWKFGVQNHLIKRIFSFFFSNSCRYEHNVCGQFLYYCFCG